MSHINELIGVARGLRLIVEAGIKLQQEQASVIWSNSTVKSVFQNCSTNQLNSLKPKPDFGKDVLERAWVVAQGVKEYAVMQVSPSDVEKTTMDPKLKSEIEELNREFTKTFESLNVEKSNVIPPFPVDNVMEVNVPPVVTIPPPMDPPVPIQTVYAPESAQASDKPKPIAKKKIKVKLSENSKERVVPSSRIGRMLSFGSLAAGLGVGTVAQYARNTFQSVAGKKEQEEDFTSAFLTPANAERIVDTLCKVRGAALKLGQLMSIQDDSVMSPALQRVFDRVRRSADFMPAWQVRRVLERQLGADWSARLASFDETPFAAASIGQVHLGVLHSGREVAIKIQYPGVAQGIDSDIDNLVGVLKVWNVFPRGMFVDNIVEVAKKELAWEVDYVREAECTRAFKRDLAPYPEYFVPEVIDELCAPEMLTTELVDAVPIERMFDADEATRVHIARAIMRLCLREMFALRRMQTDPNWANFFYNATTKQVVLLDFGATREYSKEFMDEYIEIIKAASESDRDEILRRSLEMKFLTGYESKLMQDTHVDTVMIMGEVFNQRGDFDFGNQRTTRRIQALVPTILTHRLCPPPEEIYSLQRKLSGVFLLCSKMKVKMNCRDMFHEIYAQYKAGGTR